MKKKEKESETLGVWMEEYKSCTCSFVAAKRNELLGYCRDHGNDRRYVFKLPKAVKTGQA